MAGELHLAAKQYPEELRRLAPDEEGLPLREGDILSQPPKGLPLLGGALLEKEGRAQVVDEHHRLSRYRCTRCTAMAPSPTAEATRFIVERRASPATKTPGRLVSSGYGSRRVVQRGWSPPRRSSAPDRMKPC